MRSGESIRFILRLTYGKSGSGKAEQIRQYACIHAAVAPGKKKGCFHGPGSEKHEIQGDECMVRVKLLGEIKKAVRTAQEYD